ncbi:MAG: hypothetical protein HKN30_08975 [Sulfitobacter sp.]|nr:hypothetical protein [Sulfitobacter sp.]
MDLFLGTGILAASYLLFCWAWAAHRGIPRAAWADWPGASMLICVGLTMMAPIGLGFLIKGALSPLSNLTEIGIAPLAITAVLVLMAVFGGNWFRRLAGHGPVSAPDAVNRNAAPTAEIRNRAA